MFDRMHVGARRTVASQRIGGPSSAAERAVLVGVIEQRGLFAGEHRSMAAYLRATGHHNRVKHRRRWKVRRDQRGRAYTLKPDDTIILPVDERPPDLTDDQITEHIRQRLEALVAHRAAERRERTVRTSSPLRADPGLGLPASLPT